VYLWQQLFFRPGSRIGVPLAVLGALTAAALSYFVVEQPSLRLRARLERRWALRRHAAAASCHSPGACWRSTIAFG